MDSPICSLFSRSWTIALGICWGLALAGCGSETPPDQLPVFPASVQVTVGGQPAEGVFVLLQPVPGSPAAMKDEVVSGTTDATGKVTLTTYEQNDGAPVGEYIVLIRWHKVTPEFARMKRLGARLPPDFFRGKYNNPQQPQWKVTITEGTNVLPPIAID